MSKNSTKTILVTGATGRQGGAALHHLRDRGFTVRALTRTPGSPAALRLTGPGTEITQGNLEDAHSLARALDGVHAVFSVQDYTQGYASEVLQGCNLAHDANRAAVSHFVYSSVAAADRDTGLPHFNSKLEIENYIRKIGLHFTIFRPVFFMENFFAMKPAIDQGAFSMPLSPTTRLQMIAVDDIGAFAAMAFEHPGHWANRTMELAADELSMEEIAAAFSRVIGRTVQYSQIPWDVFEQKAGKEIADMFRWFEREGFHVDLPAVRQEKQQLLTLDRWLDVNWSKHGSASGF
jgi:uncharacterized protein YbjT (DUF2867 family)